jgi:peptide/nickel transport system substrate-binding protein
MRHPIKVFGAALLVLLVGCAPGQSQGQGQSSGASSERPTQARTLTLAHRYEQPTLAPKVLASNDTGNNNRLFNASLSLIDDKGASRPYLAEALPQLNSEAWKVFPDGRMETTYRLRENLTWQDGTPLTAENFAFAYRVYKDPVLAIFIANPQDEIDAVTAPDPRTIVIQWRIPDPIAGSLTFRDLDPLPSHRLESAFTDYLEGRLSREGFTGDPIWGVEYLGAGPYKLDRWDPGVQLEGSAFDGHVLGRPKIDRVIIKYIVDENQTVANLLAGGTLDWACCNTLRFAQVADLKREWESAGKGFAVARSSTAVFLFQQLRPEVVGHEGLLDLRVRRALSHAIDRDSINDGLFDGTGQTTDTPVPPNVPFYSELQSRMTHYPLDLNRATALMGEAGYTKDSGGFFADRQGKRFFIDFAVQAASEIERMQTILSASWRDAGFEVHTVVIAPSVYTQLDTRHNLPGVGYAFFSSGEPTFRSSEIGTAANRWAGTNRSGWISQDYDRLYDQAASTLDLTQRGSYIAQMMALVSDNVPGYALYYSQNVVAWVSNLQGPTQGDAAQFGRTVRPSTNYWDIQDWSFK